MKKPIFLFMLVFGVTMPLVFSLGPFSPLIGDGTRLSVYLVNQQPDPVASGEKLELRFKIENNGTANAQDVRIKLSDEHPFTVLGDNEKNIGTVGSLQYGDDGIIVKYNLKVADNVPDGEYGLDIAYRILNGPWIRQEISGINIQNPRPVIDIISTGLSPEKIAQGSPGNLTLVLKNHATSTMYDITSDLDLETASFSPLSSTNVQFLPSLGSGEAAELTYTLVPEPDAKSKVHSLHLKLKYRDSLGNVQTRNATIGIPVFSEPSYALDVEDSSVYTADSAGDVVLSVSNTGLSDIKFLVIELEDTGEYKVISSPFAYIGNLESDDFETASFDVYLTEKAKSPVSLNAKLTYKDDYNTVYEDSKTVTFKIYSKDDAIKYALVASPNLTNKLLFFVASILLIVFAAFMLVDILKRPMPKYKKILWAVVVITMAGSFIYYVLGRKKQ